MLTRAIAIVVFGLSAVGASPAQEPACLHGSSETPAQAARRQAALRLARQVNTRESAAKNLAHTYYVLSDLPELPAAVEGFEVHLSTDGATYAFSIKDTLDPCHFAFFSDQQGLIYTGTPIR